MWCIYLKHILTYIPGEDITHTHMTWVCKFGGLEWWSELLEVHAHKYTIGLARSVMPGAGSKLITN